MPAGAWLQAGPAGSSIFAFLFFHHLLFGKDIVHHPVGFGLFGGHVEIAVRILGDPLDGLAGMIGQDLIEDLAGADDFLSLDSIVRDLPPTCP